jgi:hypothetical protein
MADSLARHRLPNLERRYIIHPTARVGDCVIILKGDYVTRAKVSADPRGTSSDLDDVGKRGKTRGMPVTEKNRRNLTAVKAMNHACQLFIRGG